MQNSAILLVSCPDRKGVVASIADFIFRHNGNILFADEHGDEASNLFLTRVEFDPADFDFDLAQFAERFAFIARDFQMNWRLALASRRVTVEALSPDSRSVHATPRSMFSCDTRAPLASLLTF